MESGTQSLGRCFTYVFPLAWEDHCKIGFSHNPLSRMQQLHHRWFEFFDLDRAFAVATETERDARDLELALRAPLAEHNAPPPSTVRIEGAGHTEWFRGAAPYLAQQAQRLRERGHVVHQPLRIWLHAALTARSDALHDWAAAQLTLDELEGRIGPTPAQHHLRDVLDGYIALGIDVTRLLPRDVHDWYRAFATQ